MQRRSLPKLATVVKMGLCCGGVAAAMMLILAGCSPADVLNALVSDEGYTKRAGLSYGQTPRQRLDVYIPKGTRNQDRPIVVYFYGGSWKSGDRDMYAFVGEAFTSLGYITIVPDYTLFPDAVFPEFVEDGARAIAWSRDNAAAFGGDPDRLVLVGHSAGAHIATLLLLDERYLSNAGVPRSSVVGGVGISGPYGFNPLAYESTRPVFDSVERISVAQPLSYAEGDAPPVMLLHGADDTTVRPINSRRLANAIQEAGGRADLRIYEGVGHIGIVVSLSEPFRGRDQVFDDLTNFLRAVAPLATTGAPDRASPKP